MKTIEIPGGSATLREPDEIRVRHKRLIEAAAVAASSAIAKLPDTREELESLSLTEMDLTAAEAAALFELQDATIVATLIGWTLPDPIPTLDTIGDMLPDVYDGLAAATRELGAAVAGGVDFAPSDPHRPEFLATPTQPSDGSTAVLRACQEPQSTEPQTSDTPSTVIAVPSRD